MRVVACRLARHPPGCVGSADGVLTRSRPGSRGTFLSRQESTQRNAPLTRRRLRRCPRLGAGLRRSTAGQNGFGDFCRSCASCARDTCASLHIGHNKSTSRMGDRQGSRKVGQCRSNCRAGAPLVDRRKRYNPSCGGRNPAYYTVSVADSNRFRIVL